MRKKRRDKGLSAGRELPLSFFACPNPDCADFNRFDAGNLSVAERMGKGKVIRSARGGYCKTCGRRFSEREGSLMAGTKVPEDVVVRMVKCLAYGCSIEATADICEVDPRTVERMLEKAGRRAEHFHSAEGGQFERLAKPPDAVEVDEVHGHVAAPDAASGAKKGGLAEAVRRVPPKADGFTRLWR